MERNNREVENHPELVIGLHRNTKANKISYTLGLGIIQDWPTFWSTNTEMNHLEGTQSFPFPYFWGYPCKVLFDLLQYMPFLTVQPVQLH